MNEEQKIIQKYFLPIANNSESLQLSNDAAYINKKQNMVISSDMMIEDVHFDKLDDPLTIFGTDYNTPDGTCIRDYDHVCDLVDAHLLGLKWLQDGKSSRAFNLGTGNGFSVREVLDQAKNITNQEVFVLEGSKRPGDCTKLVSGSSRIIAELGWSAERSNLKQMITDAWRWHQKGSYSE